MKFRLFTKLNELAGQSVVELAIVLPLLLILALGVYDFSRAIQANNIIINMSREGANLVSRSSIEQQDVMNSLASTAQPLAMGADGTMYITEVKKVGGSPIIQWPQKAWRRDGPVSRINQANVAECLGTINLEEGQTVHIFEVIYTYNCVFMRSFSPQLYSITIF